LFLKENFLPDIALKGDKNTSKNISDYYWKGIYRLKIERHDYIRKNRVLPFIKINKLKKSFRVDFNSLN